MQQGGQYCSRNDSVYPAMQLKIIPGDLCPVNRYFRSYFCLPPGMQLTDACLCKNTGRTDQKGNYKKMMFYVVHMFPISDKYKKSDAINPALCRFTPWCDRRVLFIFVTEENMKTISDQKN
jgi:hypothetical protein